MLTAKYRHASLFIQNQRVDPKQSKIMENNRWKLYGFHKQVMEGDCAHPSVDPASSSSLKNKWNAWMACKGMNRDAAMEGFITTVKEIDNNYEYKENDESLLGSRAGPDMTDKLMESNSRSGQANEAIDRNSISKKGFLRKKSDWKKNWDTRFFLLSDGRLSYYLKKGDAEARMTMRVEECQITTKTETMRIGNIPHYELSVTHSTKNIQWILACEDREDRDDWVTTLQDVRGNSNKLDRRVNSKDSNFNVSSSSSSKPEGTSAGATGNVGGKIDGVPQGSTANIPQQYLKPLEKLINDIQIAADAEQGWEKMFTKDIVSGGQMIAHRRPGDSIVVKGSAVMPYSVKDIFTLLSDLTLLPQLNPQVDTQKKLRIFNSSSSTNHIVFKQVRPAAVRDMVNFTHWRVVSGGKLVIISFNCEEYHSDDGPMPCPTPKGAVRADLKFGGYVMEPNLKEGTTKVSYVVSSDLCGSILSFVSNFVAKNQPAIICSISKYLHELPKSKLSNPKEIPTYDDLCQIAISQRSTAVFGNACEIGGTAPVPFKREDSTASNNSTDSITTKGPNNEVSYFQFKNMYYSLLLPFLLAYVVHGHRLVGFLLGCAITVPYLHRLSLIGKPVSNKYTNNVEFSNALPQGQVLVQFQVDLANLLRYVETKREEYGLDISITHVVAKAATNAIKQCPDLNGRIVGDRFYSNEDSNINISISADYSDMIAIKINQCEKKKLNTLADDLQAKSRSVRRALTTGAGAGGGQKAAPGSKVLGGGPSSRAGIVLDAFPYFVNHSIRYILRMFSSLYGVSFPALGIIPFPHGTCNIIATPRDASRDKDLEIDVGVMMVPNTDGSVSAPPVVITIGGISMKTTVEQEKKTKEQKITSVPVLNLAVSVDSRAVGFARGRHFASVFHGFMIDYKDE